MIREECAAKCNQESYYLISVCPLRSLSGTLDSRYLPGECDVQ